MREPEDVATPPDTIKAIYKLLERNELDAALDLFSADAAFDGPNRGLPAQSEALGRDAVRGHFERLRESFDEFHVEVEEVWNGGDSVVAKVRLGGRGKSGASAWGSAYHEHTIRDGQSVRLRVLEASGLELPLGQGESRSELGPG